MSLTLVLCLLLGGVFAWLLLFYKSPPVDPAWALSGSAEIPAGAVTVRFTGTSTLLFSDGETRWMVDGWFSRPGPFELLFGKIAPDLAAIGRGLAANEVTNLDAVFPVHSHYDHAMDAPEVALRTGAVLMRSESTSALGQPRLTKPTLLLDGVLLDTMVTGHGVGPRAGGDRVADYTLPMRIRETGSPAALHHGHGRL